MIRIDKVYTRSGDKGLTSIVGGKRVPKESLQMRIVLAYSKKEKVPAEVSIYLNRLSDFFFVLARFLAKLFKEEEPLWCPSIL